MATLQGQDMLVRVRKDNTDQSFETLAGIRRRQFRLSALGVDTTHVNSPSGWREFMQGAGVKSVEVSGEGVFVDALSDAKLSTAFFEREIPDFELVIPEFLTLRGPFLISELNYGGQHFDEAEFSITLKSAGALQVEAN